MKKAVNGFAVRHPVLSKVLGGLSAGISIFCFYLMFSLPENTDIEIVLPIAAAGAILAFWGIVLIFAKTKE